MNTVVDASVLVAALVDSGPHGEWAEEILAAGSLHAPELARVEATNIPRRLERAEVITTPEANAAYEDLMQLSLELFSFDPFADRVWQLRHTVTSYDAWYVAVAESAQVAARDLGYAALQSHGAEVRFPGAPRLKSTATLPSLSRQSGGHRITTESAAWVSF